MRINAYRNRVVAKTPTLIWVRFRAAPDLYPNGKGDLAVPGNGYLLIDASDVGRVGVKELLREAA